MLNRVNAKIVGVVLNKISRKSAAIYYGYGYEQYATPANTFDRSSVRWWQSRVRRQEKSAAPLTKSEVK